MPCGLQYHFGALGEQVPIVDDGEAHFIFTSDTLPVPPAHMMTDQLVIKKSVHTYNDCFWADCLSFYAQKSSYRYLGLLILAVVLQPESAQVDVALTHPASEIKTLRIQYAHPAIEELLPGYHTRPYAFDYFPDGSNPRYPWQNDCLLPTELPCFFLTHDASPHSEADWQARNIIEGLGSDRGSVLFAELLLNASRPQNTITEYVLEGDAGVRGVGPLSAEVHLELPGSFGWEVADWLGTIASPSTSSG